MQEAELREKDILIQDNLIKFSTFLQQQEMRKKKDVELTKAEERVSHKETVFSNSFHFCLENR